VLRAEPDADPPTEELLEDRNSPEHLFRMRTCHLITAENPPDGDALDEALDLLCQHRRQSTPALHGRQLPAVHRPAHALPFK
jgi:hypothetical protein